jgi:hypothetical protein
VIGLCIAKNDSKVVQVPSHIIVCKIALHHDSSSHSLYSILAEWIIERIIVFENNPQRDWFF